MNERKPVTNGLPSPNFPYSIDREGKVFGGPVHIRGRIQKPIEVPSLSIGELCGKIPAQTNFNGTERDHKEASPKMIFPYGRPFEFIDESNTQANWMFYRTPLDGKGQFGGEKWIPLIGDSSKGWYYLEHGREAVVFHGPSLRVYLFY